MFIRGPYLDDTNSRKSLLEVPMMDTGKLPMPQNFPIKGDNKNCTAYSVPNTGPNWLGVAPFLVASIGKNGY